MTQLLVIFTHLLKRYTEGSLTLLLTYNIQNILLLSLTNPVADLKCDFKEYRRSYGFYIGMFFSRGDFYKFVVATVH